jgi:hypothetical protein
MDPISTSSHKKSFSVSKMNNNFNLTKEKSDSKPLVISFNKKSSSKIKNEINPQIDVVNPPLNLKSFSTRNKINTEPINDNDLDNYLRTTNTLNFTNNFLNRNNIGSRNEEVEKYKKPGTSCYIKTSTETPINYNLVLSSQNTYNRSLTNLSNSNNNTSKNYTSKNLLK